jgi:hypothetical protein
MKSNPAVILPRGCSKSFAASTDNPANVAGLVNSVEHHGQSPDRMNTERTISYGYRHNTPAVLWANIFFIGDLNGKSQNYSTVLVINADPAVPGGCAQLTPDFFISNPFRSNETV